MQKNNSKIKKYYSMDVRAGFDAELPIKEEDFGQIQSPRSLEKRKMATPHLSPKIARKE
jgi:hypothetical protein